MCRFSILRSICVGLLFVAVLVGCAGGGDPVVPDQEREASSVRIFLGELVDEGDTIVVPVEFADAEDLYAFSFRVGFQQGCVEPLEVEWVSPSGEDISTFYLLDRPGFVPVAVANFTGEPGLSGNGTICRLRFRVLRRECMSPWLVDDPEYLVARDHHGRALRMRVGGGPR